MIQQSKGKIFLADERGMNQAAWFRSFSTFNFGKYFNEHKKPFGGIYIVNDDTLDSGHSLTMISEADSYVILLPIMGAVEYKGGGMKENLIVAGQVEIIRMHKGALLEIANPFDEGLVNFLQIWIKAGPLRPGNDPYKSTYDVEKYLNSLVQISTDSLGSLLRRFTISIGKFSGRGETIYHIKNRNSGLFLFAIEGAFEVEGRLLHARDSLALWETSHAEIEALSNDAILLAIEIML